MQHNQQTQFDEQVEALRRASDLEGLNRLKARLTDPRMIAQVEEAIENVTVIGLA